MGIWKDIQNAKKKLDNVYFRAKCNYIEYYENLPIQDKSILLESQHGTQIHGNIFYILKYLSQNEEFNDWDIYVPTWVRHRKKIQSILKYHHIQNVHLITYVSDEYFRILASAKYLVNDVTFHECFIKKDGQIYLNTWHGTPLKCLGRRVETGVHEIGNIQKNFLETDYLLCPNQCTRDALVEDNMMENLSALTEVYGGYPRNEAFFDDASREMLREKFNLQDKKVYAYMPTFRGSSANGKTAKNEIYLRYFLYELDRLLEDDEVLYVNLHPLAVKEVDFRGLRKVKEFPEVLETYECLNMADVLITDYSSVFFDFANTRRKIVLFPYDREEYLKDRGLYQPFDNLPFPVVYDVPGLLNELRSPVQYSDDAFLEEYCKYDNANASQQLIDVMLGKEQNILKTAPCPNNGKPNVLLYAGGLSGNGITASLENLISQIDLTKRNYYFTFRKEVTARYQNTIKELSGSINYLGMQGDLYLSVRDRVIRKLFKKGWIPAKYYVKLCGRQLQENWERYYGHAKFDTVIQFNGYETEMILLWSQFQGNKAIFVHSNMEEEIKTRNNQRRDVLNYAYNTYDHVAMVTKAVWGPTARIAGQDKNLTVVNNLIDVEKILKKAEMPLEINPKVTKVWPSMDQLERACSPEYKTFITVGRFSPEKGHLRLLDAFAKIQETDPNTYLVIVGGASIKDYYNKTKQRIAELGLKDHVVLVLNLPNPFPLEKMCDYFVMSSFYEGFPIVLHEAIILGKPLFITELEGPKEFMNTYGGSMVENSEEGIYQGMCQLLQGSIKPMNVDYNSYNRKGVQEFDTLFDHSTHS